ncbi:MAG: heavy metal translocating P-type ATPase [Candidatus Sericytochromatia bacterium]
MEEEEKNKSVKESTEGFCFHCGLPSRKAYEGIIEGKKREFCCSGCKTACQLIFNANADSYYKNRSNLREKPVQDDFKNYPYDSQVFRDKYLENKDGFTNIVLRLDNLHCPSCIWVIEKVLGSITGVKEINVNFTSNRANITWDESKTTLEYLLNTLVKLGYPPYPVEKGNNEIKFSKNNQALLIKMTLAAFAMLSTMFLAEPFYFKYVQDLDPKSANLLKYLALIISTPTYFYTTTPFFKGMMTTLKFKVFTMDTSIFISSTVIYLYSLLAVLMGKNTIYFDCLNMFLFFILLSRFIESTVRQKIFYQAEKNIMNYPKQATVIRPIYTDELVCANPNTKFDIFSKDNREEIVHVEEIKTSDIILIKSGEQIPVDGVIVYGETHVQESVITGESKEIQKKEGDTVLGGSINLEGSFYFKASKLYSNSTLNKIAQLVDNIQSKRSLKQNFADKISHYFILAVFILSVLVYLFYMKENPENALLIAISILIVSCPCAIGLAMPSTISISSFSAIKKGILFKSSNALDKLEKINHFVFDKTGTLTSGKMELLEIKNFSDYSDEKLLEIASAIERYSEHPIGWSIVAEANKRKVDLKKGQDFVSYTSKGVKGKLDNEEYFIGNLDFISILNISGENVDFNEINNNYKFENKVFIANKAKILACFILKDNIRDNVRETIEFLKNKNIGITLLSGDKKDIAEKTARKLGIDNYVGEVLPEEKAFYIKELKNKGYNVAMVGDGVNDAPAMVEADTSMALFSNNDIANNNAEVVILSSNFYSIVEAIKNSARSNKIIKENLYISLIYNLTVIPFAVLGYINPLAASLLMPFSSLLVVLNSLRAGR